MSPSDVLLRAIAFFHACGVETRATGCLRNIPTYRSEHDRS